MGRRFRVWGSGGWRLGCSGLSSVLAAETDSFKLSRVMRSPLELKVHFCLGTFIRCLRSKNIPTVSV